MFEFDQATAHAGDLAKPELPYVPVTDISKMSFLIWGEHCIECAAPACFATCDLYDPRPDSRCRRFAAGARRNPNFHSFRGYGVEVEFKKWAKVEARGNTGLAPAGRIRWIERILQKVAPILNVAGKAVSKVTGQERFRWMNFALGERVSRAIHRRQRSEAPPSAFLLEVYNPEAAAMNLNLTIAAARDHRQHAQGFVGISSFYRTMLALPPGYSRHLVDYRLIGGIAERGSFDVSLTPEGDGGGRLVFLTADFVRFPAEPEAHGARQIKCVVWDLDNTLWDGILLEGVQPAIRPEALRLIRFLDDRGVLLSIASKNDSETAMAALRALGVADYFLHSQINWNPKSHSIRRIAEALNIGVDTFAFIDDNPFEREEVAAGVPGVVCIDPVDLTQLAADPRFQGSTSSEARARRRMYQEAIQREDVERRYSGDYVGFLRTCGIRLEVDGYVPADFDRAAELVQRTNQLNFSGRKYTREQLIQVLEDPGIEKYVLRCSDKFGSYGTIGFALVRQGDGELVVDDFMVSCRVQGKFLEQAFFAHILESHNPRDARTIRVNYQQTAKNTPAGKVLESIGFTSGEGPGRVLPENVSLACDFIAVGCSACVRQIEPSLR